MNSDDLKAGIAMRLALAEFAGEHQPVPTLKEQEFFGAGYAAGSAASARATAAAIAAAPPEDLKDWAGVDGAIAWHMIDRAGNNWADIARMMEAWADARAVSAAPASVNDSELLLAACRRAIPALAHAAEKSRIYKDAYNELDAAIEAATARRKQPPSASTSKPGQAGSGYPGAAPAPTEIERTNEK